MKKNKKVAIIVSMTESQRLYKIGLHNLHRLKTKQRMADQTLYVITSTHIFINKIHTEFHSNDNS